MRSKTKDTGTAARRRKGTGTIIKVGAKYYGRIVLNGKVVKKPLSPNLREAERLWKQWLAENVDTVKVGSLSVEIKDTWPKLEACYKARSVSDRRLMSYHAHWAGLCNWFQDNGITDLNDVTANSIKDAVETIGEGLSDYTREEILRTCSDMFAICMKGMPNPAKEVRLRKREEVESREPLTQDEIDRLLKVAERRDHKWKVLLEVALYTGMRRIDCVMLRAEQVRDGTVEITPRKTVAMGTMVRIPLHPTLKAELDTLGVESGYYFPELVDLYESERIAWTLRQIFSKALGGDGSAREKAGRRRKVSVKGFHALRATFITKLAEAGVSLPIMESLAGHINPRQTMQYTHPAEAVKKAAVGALSFGDDDDELAVPFIPPEVQRILDHCRKSIEDVLAKQGIKAPVEVKAFCGKGDERKDLAVTARKLYDRIATDEVMRGRGLYYTPEEAKALQLSAKDFLKLVMEGRRAEEADRKNEEKRKEMEELELLYWRELQTTT